MVFQYRGASYTILSAGKGGALRLCRQAGYGSIDTNRGRGHSNLDGRTDESVRATAGRLVGAKALGLIAPRRPGCLESRQTCAREGVSGERDGVAVAPASGAQCFALSAKVASLIGRMRPALRTRSATKNPRSFVLSGVSRSFQYVFWRREGDSNPR
jgi:hypothetical protein